MKTVLLLTALAALPAFAAGGSPSGSYPPSYFHQETPGETKAKGTPSLDKDASQQQDYHPARQWNQD